MPKQQNGIPGLRAQRLLENCTWLSGSKASQRRAKSMAQSLVSLRRWRFPFASSSPPSAKLRGSSRSIPRKSLMTLPRHLPVFWPWPSSKPQAQSGSSFPGSGGFPRQSSRTCVSTAHANCQGWSWPTFFWTRSGPLCAGHPWHVWP